MPGQVPTPIWGQPRTERQIETFMEAAGMMNHREPTQQFLCAYCVAENDLKAPETIIMINGTTVCINHRINLVN